MRWIRLEKRLAIYLRDGLACAYCGTGVEVGVQLTLDHLKPRIKEGCNDASNLVTCCMSCNSSRQQRSVAHFAAAVASYRKNGTTAEEIVARVRRLSRRSLVRHLDEAKAILSRRGSIDNFLADYDHSKP